MPTIFNEANVLCPFYKRTAPQSITCEGIEDESSTKIQFASEKKTHFYRTSFCSDKYQNCKIYKMLEKKYEDEK